MTYNELASQAAKDVTAKAGIEARTPHEFNTLLESLRYADISMYNPGSINNSYLYDAHELFLTKAVSYFLRKGIYYTNPLRSEELKREEYNQEFSFRIKWIQTS